jgi:tetratricopeptide (TPR) repeat protein
MIELETYPSPIPVATGTEARARVARMVCSCGGPLKRKAFEHFFDTTSRKYYELLAFTCGRCGGTRHAMFDITAFYVPGREMRLPLFWVVMSGACLLAGLFAKGEGRGWYTLAGLMAGFAVLSYALVYVAFPKPGRRALPDPAATPGGDRDSDMIATLQTLGVPLDFAVSSPEAGLFGGMVKAALYLGHDHLREGRLEEAADSFTSAIEAAEATKANAALLAVCYSQRGEAREKQGRTAEARADYAKARKHVPDHAPAREGQDRLFEGERCPACRSPLPGGAATCPGCGLSLEGDTHDEQPPTDR